MRILLAGMVIFGLGSVTFSNARADYVPANGTFNGLMYESSGVWQQSSGYISIQTTPRGTYSGVLRVGTGRYQFSGKLDANGQATRDILRYQQYPLTLSFHVDPQDPDLIYGTITDGVWTADMIADRAVFNGKTSITPDAGRYTLIIPGDFSKSDAPGGDSFGTVTINKAGRITFSGTLAEGRKFTQSTTISRGGQWPLYAPLYNGQGSMYGWMLFNDPEGEDVAGDVTWIKPERAQDWYYSKGFAISVYAWGSRYTKPPAKTRIIDVPAGTIEFNGGNLIRGITNQFTISQSNAVKNYAANGLQLRFSTLDGTFSGQVKDPITWEWIPFRGVVLQRYSLAAGYFLGWDQSGEVWLQAQ